MAVTDVRAASALVADEPGPARSRTWLRSLDIVLPAALIALIVFACFVLPVIAPIPKPTGGGSTSRRTASA